MARIVETAHGNPSFALELARAAGAGDTLAVPQSVWETVTARFLDDATAAMLRRLAVAGGDLDPGGVLAPTGLAEPDAFALLDAGLEAGALVVAEGRYRFRFRHDLVRRALAEQVPPHHRVAMHRARTRLGRRRGAGIRRSRDGHLCINQRLLYGARPHTDVIAFADAFAAEAERLGAARGRAYAATLRGEALLLSGRLDEAEADLGEAIRLSRAGGGAVAESLALQRLAEAALYRGDRRAADALLDESPAVARESDVGFHLLDRSYGTRMAAAADPDAALAALDDAESSVRGPLETCPGRRITLVVPGAIAAARAGDLDRAAEYETTAQWLADVVMRLPAWDAALHEVRGHRAQAAGEPAASHFTAAATGFRTAGRPLDEERCIAFAGRSRH